jgi:GMP synthase (glutamine-hydrolysing)
MKQVLIVRAGRAPAAVRERLGDFGDWFAEGLGPRAHVALADPGALPDPAGWDGILVTGSLDSVTARAPWMEALGSWLLGAARRRPVLGVCFGHQLLGSALGGRVERHAAGPEAGTVEIELTAAGRRDPLFAGLPERLPVQECHEDHVSAPPPGAVALAASAHTPLQSFAHGPLLRAVQFHPEFNTARLRALLESDPAWLDRIRPGLTASTLNSLREAPLAARVLANWLEAYVGG